MTEKNLLRAPYEGGLERITCRHQAPCRWRHHSRSCRNAWRLGRNGRWCVSLAFFCEPWSMLWVFWSGKQSSPSSYSVRQLIRWCHPCASKLRLWILNKTNFHRARFLSWCLPWLHFSRRHHRALQRFPCPSRAQRMLRFELKTLGWQIRSFWWRRLQEWGRRRRGISFLCFFCFCFVIKCLRTAPYIAVSQRT